MKKYYLLLSFIALFHVLFLYNLKFTAWPEMLSYPYLLNNGFLLYKDMIHPYPPILTVALSGVYKLFGYSEIVIKIFTWIVIISNDLIIFLLLKKLTKNNILGLLAVLTYSFTQPFLEGNQMWFDLAIVPFVLTGLYFFINSQNKKNLLISGFFVGLAVFIKQTSGLFLILLSVVLFFEKDFKKIIIFLLGPVIIFLILIFRLTQEHAILDFFNWTLFSPFMYWNNFPGYVQMYISKLNLFKIFLLSFPSVIFFIFSKDNLYKNKNFILLFFSLLISVILVYPRFSFFHLQLFIALITILNFYLFSKNKNNLIIITMQLFLICAVVIYPVIKTDWGIETRFFGKNDKVLSEKILRLTKDSNIINFIGIPSSQFVFTNKIPNKIWGDNFGWYYVDPKVETGIIDGWSKNPSKYVVWKEPEPGNWYDLATYQPPVIKNWLTENYSKNTEIVAGVWLWVKK